MSANRQSAHLDGVSIFQRLEQSSFGRFHAALKDIGDSVAADGFTLPRVVVVGCESTGKSSLMEKLTKCHLFPRGEGICTKMPVRLEMVHDPVPATATVRVHHGTAFDEHNVDAEHILPGLQAYMAGLTGISQEELVIEIHSPFVRTFTLIDLPGIRAYPTDMATATRALARKYLADPNCLVLCVVPATTPRLTSAESIGLVLEHVGKPAQTILALTMADRVREPDWATMVAQRVTGVSDEVTSLGLAGCVAVMNRTHDDTMTLVEADTAEAAFFDRMWRPSDFPQHMMRHCGITSLVDHMDALYNAFIRSTWKPRALDIIRTKVEANDAAQAALGAQPVTMRRVLTDVKEWLDANWYAKLGQQLQAPACSIPATTVIHEKHVIAALPGALGMLSKAARAFRKEASPRPVLLSLLRDAFTDHNALHLARFERARDQVKEVVDKAFAELLRTRYAERAEELVQVYRMDAYQSGALPDANAFRAALRRIMIAEAVLPALHGVTEKLTDAELDAPAVECGRVAAERAGLRAARDKLQGAQTTIAGL